MERESDGVKKNSRARKSLEIGAGRGGAGMPGRSISSSESGLRGLYRLQVKEIWNFVLRQPASFWAIAGYLFIEYVRPQAIYSAIYAWPLAEVMLMISVIALVVEGKITRQFNVADGGLMLFGAVVFLSASLAWDPGQAFGNLKVVLSWFIVYYLVTNLVDTEGRFLVFMLSFLLYSLKMSQHATRSWAGVGFGFRKWGVTGAPGWFQNSGEFAVQMAIFIPLAVFFILGLRKYWKPWKTWLMWVLPATGILGVIASSSRGGQLGVAAVVLVMAAKSRKKVKAVSAVIVVALAAYAFMPEAQIERWETAGEDGTSQARITYWENGLEIMNDRPVFGVGHDNWLPYYRRYYDPEAGQVPHSIYIEAGTELGYLGLFAFLLLAGLTFLLNYRTRRMALRCRGDPSFLHYISHGLDVALVGFMVSGAFVTVLWYPFFWINLAMTSALYNVTRKKYRETREAAVRRPEEGGAETWPTAPLAGRQPLSEHA